MVGLGLALAAAAVGRALVRRTRSLSLRGRSVLITGGSRGLGLLLAEELGRAGARVSICGRDGAAVDRARVHLEARGVDVLARVCDLGDRTQAEQLVDEVARERGGVDVVVNNAGVMQVAPLEAQTAERIEEVMQANFASAVYVTLRALPYLRESATKHTARIVNIVSIGGRVAMPHMIAYDASKFALMGFSEALRAELAASRPRIPVTSVIPGPMRTGSFYNAEFAGKQQLEFAWFALLSSLPIASIDARRAARRVVGAMQQGAPFVHLGVSSWLLDLLHRLSPSLTVRAMTVLAKLLPSSPGYRGALAKGRDVGAHLAGEAALHLGDVAARRHNESPPPGAR